MANVAAAFPFVTVAIDTSALQPVAQRSPGVIAVAGASGPGSAAVDAPTVVESAADVVAAFGAGTPLTTSINLALLQDPKPSKIYGVKVGGVAADADVKSALDALLAVDDVDFVSLARMSDAARLVNLKHHVEQASAAGNKRIGVAMVDPATAKSPTYAQDVFDGLHPAAAGNDLMSTVSRMVIVAARGSKTDDGATADVATAAMSAMAGYAPSTSIVLKRVRGFSVAPVSQYTSTEIKALSEFNIIPLIQPALLVGGGIVFGEGRCFTSDASLLYVDIVRTLDDIDFRLKAGLLGPDRRRARHSIRTDHDPGCRARHPRAAAARRGDRRLQRDDPGARYPRTAGEHAHRCRKQRRRHRAGQSRGGRVRQRDLRPRGPQPARYAAAQALVSEERKDHGQTTRLEDAAGRHLCRRKRQEGRGHADRFLLADLQHECRSASLNRAHAHRRDLHARVDHLLDDGEVDRRRGRAASRCWR